MDEIAQRRTETVTQNMQRIHGSKLTPQQDEQEVGIEISFVDFVDDDMRDAAKTTFELPKQHTDGAEEGAAVWTR